MDWGGNVDFPVAAGWCRDARDVGNYEGNVAEADQNVEDDPCSRTVLCLGGLGFRVWGLGFRVEGSELGIQG